MVEPNDLVENPTARVPVCLCLDVSSSMDGAPIDELNEGVKIFFDAIKDDEIAMFSAEIAIVTFGSDVQCVRDFGTIEGDEAPHLRAYGNTLMGEAVNMALDMLERRKDEYKENGVNYYQPWLVVMTDGQPNGSQAELERAIERTVSMINGKKLTIFPIGIGEDADMDLLARFSPKRTPLRLKGLNFREFFTWLSRSVSATSQSTPGESIKLDTDGIAGWGTL